MPRQGVGGPRAKAGRCRQTGGPCPHDLTGKHGRASTYGNHGCRCGPCCDAKRESNRARAWQPCAKVNETCPHLDTIKHGTAYAYAGHRCRCDLCVASWRESETRRVRRRNQRLRRRVVEIEHGTRAGHVVWGCSCRPCRLAAARYNREAYVRRRDGENPRSSE